LFFFVLPVASGSVVVPVCRERSFFELTASGAAHGLIFESFLFVKSLFAFGKDKIVSTIFTCDLDVRH
jgi:hypothetical protein